MELERMGEKKEPGVKKLKIGKADWEVEDEGEK